MSEAKGIQVQDTTRVKNMMVEDDVKSASLTLNNQNFATNNNNISAGMDGTTTTTNDRMDFGENVKLNAGKTITGDAANFTSVDLDGGNLATQLTKMSENATNIANNTTKINENLVQRISNDNDIASNSNRTTQNANRIVSNESSMNGHDVSVQSNSTRTNTNTSNITSNTDRMSTNESGMNTIKTDVATNTTNIGNNATNVSNDATNVGSNATNVDNTGTKMDHFTVNPANINVTNKDFLVNELPTGATAGTTNIQLGTNGDVISKKLQSDDAIDANDLTTKSMNVETTSQKQTDGTHKSFDLNNLTTTTNNTTTTNADDLVNETNNSAPLFVDAKSVHMNGNLSLNHNTMENIKGLEFATTQSPSMSCTLNDETMQINKNSLPSAIIPSSASDTKMKAKEIEGADGEFTNLCLDGSTFDPSTSSAGTTSGIASDGMNGLTFSTKSEFEKKLTTLSDCDLSNEMTNDATNGLAITGNESTFEKLTLKNVVGLLENLPCTAELSDHVDSTQNNVPSTPDALHNKNVDVFERLIVRQPDPNGAFGTDVHQNSGDDCTGSTSTICTKNGTSITESGERFQANFALPVQMSRWMSFDQLNDFSSQPQEIALIGSDNNSTWEHIQDHAFATERTVGDAFVHFPMTTSIDDFKSKVPSSTTNAIQTTAIQGTSVNGGVCVDKTIQTTNFCKHHRWIVEKMEQFDHWSINELELFGHEKKIVDVGSKTTELMTQVSVLETKLNPMTSSSDPNEHQFSSSIFVNGLRSTTQPQSDGIHSGKDINNASSTEMVSSTCCIDFVHPPGSDCTNRILSNGDGVHFAGDAHVNDVKIGGVLTLDDSIQKNDTKTECGDVGDTTNHHGSSHHFCGPATNHLQDTQVIVNNGSLKTENVVLKRDDNNTFHINANNQPAFVTTGTHSTQNGSLAVEGILKMKNDFDEPPISSALNIQAHQNDWISFSVGTEEKANAKWDGTNPNFSVKDAKFRVNDMDALDEISKLKNRVGASEANAGLTPGEDGNLHADGVPLTKNHVTNVPILNLPGVSDDMRPFFQICCEFQFQHLQDSQKG
eukprot:jgi/Bigna1/140062/aug1.54_g14770